MDIAIEKKKAPNFKKYAFFLVLIIVSLLVIKFLWSQSQADFSIDSSSLVIGEVKRDNFTVSVRGSGVLVPDSIQWLSAEVDAKVERLVVKAGNVVKADDLIVQLSNPQLVQRLAEVKWEMEAMSEESKAARVAQETNLIEHKSNVLNIKLDYEKAGHEYEAHKELIDTGAVSRLDYQNAKVNMEQFFQRWKSTEEQHAKLKENLQVQNNARAARLSQIEKRIERIQRQVDDLQVKATMDSIVLEVPLEVGQRLAMGANIAKLAQQNDLIAELQVPEIQIRDVNVGQRVIIDTRNSKIEGKVSRVDPAVVNGNVQVDVTFSEALPDDARPDLSVDGEIKITEISDTLFVDRPLFSQSQSESSLYKLSDDGQFAERVEVTLGYGSINEIQIIKGLSVGDRIITSDPTRFEAYQKIRIN